MSMKKFTVHRLTLERAMDIESIPAYKFFDQNHFIDYYESPIIKSVLQMLDKEGLETFVVAMDDYGFVVSVKPIGGYVEVLNLMWEDFDFTEKGLDIDASGDGARLIQLAYKDILPSTDPVTEASRKMLEDSEQNALNRQVDGSHYKGMKIQPITFIEENGLSFSQGAVIKYVCRYKNKNGKADLKKAIHFLEMMIEREYPE